MMGADSARRGPRVDSGEGDPVTGPPDGSEPPTQSLGSVVGENVRRIREERVLTQHELAQIWQRHGLNWARSKVAALEGGKRPRVDYGELAVMALAMGVPLEQFFQGTGLATMDPSATRLSRQDLRRLVAGDQPAFDYYLGNSGALHRDEEWTRERLDAPQSANADVDLARRLGVDPRNVVVAAMGLFDGLTLTAERDRRADRLGRGQTMQERQAHRGHITRELTEQVERRLREMQLTESVADVRGSTS